MAYENLYISTRTNSSYMDRVLALLFILSFAMATNAFTYCQCDYGPCSGSFFYGVTDQFSFLCNGMTYYALITFTNTSHVGVNFSRGSYSITDFFREDKYRMQIGPTQSFGMIVGRNGISYNFTFCNELYCINRIDINLENPNFSVYPGKIISFVFNTTIGGTLVNVSANLSVDGALVPVNQLSLGRYNSSFSFPTLGTHNVTLTVYMMNDSNITAIGEELYAYEVGRKPLAINMSSPIENNNFLLDETIDFVFDAYFEGNRTVGVPFTGLIKKGSITVKTFSFQETAGLYSYSLSERLVRGYYSIVLNTSSPEYTVSFSRQFTVDIAEPSILMAEGYMNEYERTNNVKISVLVLDNITRAVVTDANVSFTIRDVNTTKVKEGTAVIDPTTNYYKIYFDAFALTPGNYTIRVNASWQGQYGSIQFPFTVKVTSQEYVVTVYCLDENSYIKCTPGTVSEFRNDSSVTFITYVSNISDQGRVIKAKPESLYILLSDMNTSKSFVYYMYDDGTHGDSAPNDNLYTTTGRMNETHTYSLRGYYNFSGYLFYSNETYLGVMPVTGQPSLLPSFNMTVSSPVPKTYAIEKPVELQVGVFYNGSLIDDALVSAYLSGPESAIYTLAFDSSLGSYAGESIISTVGDYTVSYVVNKEGYETTVANVSFSVKRFEPNLMIQIKESEFYRYIEKKFEFNVSKGGVALWADTLTAKVDGRYTAVSMDGNIGQYFFKIIPNKTMYLVELYAESGTDFGYTRTFLNVLEKILMVELISPKTGTSIESDKAVEIIAIVRYLSENQPDARTRFIVQSVEGEEIQEMEFVNGTYRGLFTPQKEGEYTIIVSATKPGFREGMDSVVVLTKQGGFGVPIRIERSLVIIVVALALLAIIAYYLRLF